MADDDDTAAPPDPPCVGCGHPLSRHDDDECSECAAWGGPCA